MVTYNRNLITPRRVKVGDFLPLRTLSGTAGKLARDRMLKGLLFQQVGDTLRKVTTLGSLSMQDIVEQAALGSSGDLKESLDAFSQALKFRATRKAGMLTIHEQIGAQAQQAIVASYDAARAFSPLSYRVGDRYAGGKLRAALLDPNFYIPQPDGLLFINTALLDQKAKQWYRLNFGAGIAGFNGHSRNLPFIFGGQNTGLKIGLERFGPSAPFDMPLGVFGNTVAWAEPESETSRRGVSPFSTGSFAVKHKGRSGNIFAMMLEGGSTKSHGAVGDSSRNVQGAELANLEKAGIFSNKKASRGHRDPFTPISQLPTGLKPRRAFLVAARPTYGITPELFFEAGVRSLVQTIPPAYLRLARTWFEEAVEEGKGPAHKSGATAAHLGALVRRGV